MSSPNSFAAVLTAVLLLASLGSGVAAQEAEPVGTELFVQLLSSEAREGALRQIGKGWQASYVPMLLEVARLCRDRTFALRLLQLIDRKTGEGYGTDVDLWWQWVWNRQPDLHPEYPDWKAALHGYVDPKFRGYFSSRRVTRIRLDEVMWGGVWQDGIPPLRSPKMIAASDAAYLEAGDVVFALEIEGDARASTTIRWARSPSSS